MRFHIGYQNEQQFKKFILDHSDQLSELYFPWETFTTGRGVSNSRELQEKMESDLAEFSRAGIDLCLLLNGNCYGSASLSRSFFQRLGDTVDHIREKFNLRSVTTASPLIAKFLHKNFPGLHLQASVNMEIGTPEGVEYILDYFDSFYLKREYNYKMDAIVRMRDFCHSYDKKLFLLANSGCLNYCSARTFHDNLVAHQHEISEMDNAFVFQGICSTFLENPENREGILSKSNFIRPEDIPLYEELCDGIKLATRTNHNPAAVTMAYFTGAWHGNLLDLTEPAHSEWFLPKIIANRLIPEEYAHKRFRCSGICEKCGYCKEIQKNATIQLSDN